MAVANVDIQVDARSALQQLKAVNQQSQQLKANTDAATQSLKNQGTTAQRIGTQFSGLASAVGRLAVAYVGLRTAQEAVQAGIQREESSRRLQFLAKGYGEIAAAQDAAARAGRTFGLSITESNQQFAQLYGRLRPLNVSLSDIEAAFVGFNTAAKVSGATAAESAGALLQLTQALGSGVLRGQELNSVLEQAPGLVVALTRELGTPISQIRKLAEEGKITSDVVIRALKRAGTEGADELAAAMNGPAQAVKNLQNEFENLQVAATKDLLPSIIEAIKGLKELLITLGPVIRGIGHIAAQTFNTVSDLINAATKPGAFAAGQAIRGGRLPMAGFGGMTGAGELFKGTSGAGGVGLTGIRAEAAQLARLRRQPVTTVLLELMRNRLGRMDAAAQPIRSEAAANALTQQLLGRQVGGGGGGGGGRGEASRAQRERERAAKAAAQEQSRVAQVIRDRMAEAEMLDTKLRLAAQINTAETSGDQMLVERLRGQQALIDLQYKYAQQLADEKDIKAQEAIIHQGTMEMLGAQFDTEYKLQDLQKQRNQDQMNALQALIEKQYEMNTAVQQQEALANSVSATLGQSMTSAFDLLIKGAESWSASLKQIASSALVDIANQLIRIYVIEQAVNAIQSFLTPFSYGKTPIGAGGGMKGRFGTLGPNYGIPQRATGGSVTGGQPYLVGERGPELFMPGRSGGIAPSGSFGGGPTVVVNVDASGTSVQGNQPEGQALGRAVAAAVQAELIKQKRPGGILA